MLDLEESMSSQAVDDELQPLGDLSLDERHTNEQADLSGIKLCTGPYQLGKILRKDNHYNVYSVKSLSLSDHTSTAAMEARTYLLDGLPSKLRKYRLKSMQRLCSRKVVEEEMRGLVIVVYTVDSRVTKELEKTTISQAICQIRNATEHVNVAKPKEKSERQREAARRRQLERRQMNRRLEKWGKEWSEEKAETEEEEGKQRSQQKGEEAEGREREHKSKPRPIDDEETLHVLLHAAYRDHPKLCQLLPSVSPDVLNAYLRNQPLRFEDAEEMEAFIEIKSEEHIFLCNMESVMQQRMEHMIKQHATSLQRLVILEKGSAECTHEVDMVARAQKKLSLVIHVKEAIPSAIDNVWMVLVALEVRFKGVQRLEKEIKDREASSAQRTRLIRKGEFCEKFAEAILPGSTIFWAATHTQQAFRLSVRKTLSEAK